MVTMESIIKRKQSLEEEIKICELMLSFEHRREMRNKIRVYLNSVQREFMDFMR